MTASDLLSLLAEMIDFLDNQSDAEIIDGKIHPNKAMSLMGACEKAYEQIEKSGGIANDLVRENHEGRGYWEHNG
jgi:hypothetical protein